MSIERFVWSNEKANECIEKMNSEEVKNNVNFLQQNVYLDTERLQRWKLESQNLGRLV